jgi:23S rRNA (adenine2503-C2)-methyltransferase
LTPDEIIEQVTRFDAELLMCDQGANGGGASRVSNVVFMGMGEPLANYRIVWMAINRITQDLEIGTRKITVSTVVLFRTFESTICANMEMRAMVQKFSHH